MDKNKVYYDFLNALRVAITNASVYFKDHPLFRESVNNLRKKIEDFFSLADPLIIGIAANYLLIGDERLEDKKLYKEIVDFIHQRKIKRIEIRKGITNRELIIFLIQLNLHPKAILRKGGLANILKKENVQYIVVEDLNYSLLLRGAGQEVKDIWLYLLKDSFQQGNYDRLDLLADNFEKILTKENVGEILDDKDSLSAFNKFFNQLKSKNKNQFLKCTKNLVKFMLRGNLLSDKKMADKLKDLLGGLAATEISEIILEEFESGNILDPLNFRLLTQLLNSKDHQEVANSLADKLAEKKILRNNPQMAEKIKRLLSPEGSAYISQAYKHCLFSLLEGISLGEGRHFDRLHLKENYRLILLELFILEVNPENLNRIIKNILLKLDEAIQNGNRRYIENFLEALIKKKKKDPSLASFFLEADKFIVELIEEPLFKQRPFLDLESFAAVLDNSILSAGFYLEKIFKEGRTNPYLLYAFTKLFPADLPFFYESLNRKSSDPKFIKEIIKSLVNLDSNLRLNIFKHIFSWHNNLINLEILKVMLENSISDDDFLLSILDNHNYIIRKAALEILVKQSRLKDEVGRKLLYISNPLGLRTKIIKQNLLLIEKVFFEETRQYLLSLSRYRFFWNKSIRRQAKDILEKHGH